MHLEIYFTYILNRQDLMKDVWNGCIIIVNCGKRVSIKALTNTTHTHWYDKWQVHTSSDNGQAKVFYKSLSLTPFYVWVFFKNLRFFATVFVSPNYIMGRDVCLYRALEVTTLKISFIFRRDNDIHTLKGNGLIVCLG